MLENDSDDEDIAVPLPPMLSPKLSRQQTSLFLPPQSSLQRQHTNASIIHSSTTTATATAAGGGGGRGGGEAHPAILLILHTVFHQPVSPINGNYSGQRLLGTCAQF